MIETGQMESAGCKYHRSGLSFNAETGGWVQLCRKRWHGGVEWCQMFCKLGLKSKTGTRLQLYDRESSERARYVLDAMKDQLDEIRWDEGDLVLTCRRARGTDCEKPDKVQPLALSLVSMSAQHHNCKKPPYQ